MATEKDQAELDAARLWSITITMLPDGKDLGQAMINAVAAELRKRDEKATQQVSDVAHRMADDIIELKSQLTQAKQEIEQTKSYLEQCATDGRQLCEQLGRHLPVPNTGCFGDDRCVHCFQLGFALIEGRNELVTKLRDQLAALKAKVKDAD